MKTFLGVHYPPVGRRDGFGFFRDAGYAGLATIDCGYPIEPGAFYATRFTVNGSDNPNDFYSDPIGSAGRWYAALQTKWQRNPGARCRIINNELDLETPWHAERQNEFYLEFMRVNDMFTSYEKIGICSYAGGNPSDNPPYTLEQRWRPMLPAIKYAGEHGHFVVLHIHQQSIGPMETPTPDDPRQGQSISLRHRRSIAYWLDSAQHPECVIIRPPRIIFNEVSNGVGGVEPDLNGWIKSVTWLDQYMRTDPYNSLYTILGLYQAGGDEPISKAAYQKLAEYVSSQSEITINPLPIAPPPDQVHFDIAVARGQRAVFETDPADNDLREWCAGRGLPYQPLYTN